jgi:hypothetical protein
MIDQSYRLPCDRHAALNYVQKVGLNKTVLQPCDGVKPQSLATVVYCEVYCSHDREVCDEGLYT